MSKVNVAWKPLPGSQALALSCPANHILYEGTRGPGKTDCQLMFFRRFVGIGYGASWRGVIFDRGYKSLDDLIGKSQRWFPKLDEKAQFKAAKSDYRWVWPTGEQLLFRQIKKASDYWNYHGQEFPFIGWNELSKYPTPDLYDAMMSCNRSSFLPEEHASFGSDNKRLVVPPIPLAVFSTTNPYGPGHNWIKARFIDAAPPGKMIRTTTNVFDPALQERRDVVKTQVRIFGSYKENRYLPAEYIAELENITDDNKRRAWLWGDWDIVAGGALDDVWGQHLVLPRFRIPPSWRVDRSLDWGSTHPFSVGFWATATLEPARLPDGTLFAPFPGSLIRIAEWYGTPRIGTNKGLKLSATDLAIGIRKREDELRMYKWISTPVYPGPADSQIRANYESDSETLASKMEKHGVTWHDSNKSPGSRITGLELLRDRMEASRSNNGPGIYFMDNCAASLKLLPTIPRDEDNPDDVDTESEDHLYDDVRYRVLHKARLVTVTELPF